MICTPSAPTAIPVVTPSAVTVTIDGYSTSLGAKQSTIRVHVTDASGNATPYDITMTPAQTKAFYQVTGTDHGDCASKAVRAVVAQWLGISLANVTVTTTITQDVA